MSVAENMALRSFDRSPLPARRLAVAGKAHGCQAGQLDREPSASRRRAPVRRSARCRAATCSAPCWRASCRKPICRVLIVANPVFGLDFAAVAEIHDRLLAARNGGAAVLLVSEDLDELLELSDRIVVMSDGRIVHETVTADIAVIGPCMAGHSERLRSA
jgi:hypothetical protein